VEGAVTYTIRCLTGDKVLWSEAIEDKREAEAFYLHKAKLAQQYGPTATAFRFEFLRDGEVIDAFETNAVEES
jgi:hypothetical protein